MELRAYSVCRTCVTAVPAGHGCPCCDGAPALVHVRPAQSSVAAEAPAQHRSVVAGFSTRPILTALSALAIVIAVVATVIK